MTNRGSRVANLEANESIPLNNTQEQIPNGKIAMDAETKRVLTKVALDVVLLGCVGIPILMFFLFGVPYERGFNCNDESLMYPFKESTVTHEVLYTLGFGIPIISIIITEFIRWKLGMEAERDLKIFGHPIPIWFQHCYKYIGIFLFGAACSQMTTDIAKYTIGRLRPHFFDVCKPAFLDGTPINCTDPKNFFTYITEFTCSNPKASARKLKEVRLSFMSGHSSFSMYTMLFTALFLHVRMTWKGSKLAKHFLQFVFLSMAWYTALSRISNYKHHWSDVLAGTLQGVIIGVLIVFGVSDLFKNRWSASKDSKSTVSRYELDDSNSRAN
ncbi:unnamed protein product [Chironomus riparius]|uniref:Phosphatidic acid phosphatase type 2/haloperoxidase domain-containing protein n=1 Tax=Chironomus riparius TaxID=315576 RepID=A0A9N9WR34_9DIPT|nr:unnamed protein product [Chironomus riparius]